MAMRLLEPTIVDLGQQRAGYFDLVGRWQGSELMLEDHATWSRQFRSGLRIDQASVTLRWHPYWSCKSAFAGDAIHAESNRLAAVVARTSIPAANAVVEGPLG